MKFIEIVTLVITVFISQIESASFQDKELINAFKSKIPSCNDEARLWIRAAYHDAGTFSSTDTTPVGCDGSLQFELDRPENNGLRPAIDFYKQLATKFQISMADAIAFGGIVAVQVCAPGIQISFSPGRTDAKTANPSGRLPNARISASDILSMFRDRLGFTVNELVALIGSSLKR